MNDNVATPTFNILSACSGIGGLDLGIHLAHTGARTVCYVEREGTSAAILAARMRDRLLREAPIWSDLTTFSGEPWRGAVDCFAAGFPCQDVSLAGKGAGLKEGTRTGLWFECARIIRETQPGFVFLENVPGLVRRGLSRVLGDLDELGFDAEWGLFSAAGVGAPHSGNHTDGRRSCVWPPGPNEAEAWKGVPTEAQPAICGVADGLPARNDRLRALGNGVVPLVAAHAFRTLADRLECQA